MSQDMESYCEAIGCMLHDGSPPIILYIPVRILRNAWRVGYRSHTHILEWISFTTHTQPFLSRSCVYRNNVHAPIISRRGRQSVRGIFRLTDFHLQSGDVTFVWGNEIALQQTVGYIIPSQAHILLSFFFSPLSAAFSHIVHQPLRHKKARLPGSISHFQGVVERRGSWRDKSHGHVGVAARW